jgi:hypothetical protein
MALSKRTRGRVKEYSSTYIHSLFCNIVGRKAITLKEAENCVPLPRVNSYIYIDAVVV